MRNRRRAIVLPATAAAACLWAATASGQTATGQAGQQQPPPSPRIPSGREPTQSAPPQPKPVVTSPDDVALAFQKSGGSLLRTSLAAPSDANQANPGLMSYTSQPEPEPKTLRKHDLITIVIKEESEFTSKGDATLKREADFDAQLQDWARLNIDRLTLSPTGGTGATNFPEVKMTGTRNFTGDGSVDRSDTLTARITGEIVDIKPNGTLVVQARKLIRTDEEEQQFILSGTCRAEDVAADNTVLSTQIFDLQLQKNHKGTVREATRRTWLQKLLDVVSPF